MSNEKGFDNVAGGYTAKVGDSADALPAYQYQSFGYKAKCYHGGTKLLWTLPNGRGMYAAQEANLALNSGHGIVLDCTGFPNKKSEAQREAARAAALRDTLVFDRATQYASLVNYIEVPTPRIAIDWPDGGAPPLIPAFWSELLRLAEGSVCVACVGSHGRTGTALAAMYMAQHAPTTPHLTLAQVVRYIRKVHCDAAIETLEQIEYLETVADAYGVTVTDEYIEGSYETRYGRGNATTATPKTTTTVVPVSKPVDTSAVTRAVVAGRDAETGIPTTLNGSNGGLNKRARKRAARAAKGVE